MSLLDRKLVRDISAARGQVVTIALVVAAGLSVLIGSISAYDSLKSARDRFYSEARFPRIFVTLKRAPVSLAAQMEVIPGVAAVEPRIVRDVIVDLPASPLPVSARMVSLAHAGDETLARLHLRRGSAPSPGDSRGAAINEAFSLAQAVQPGADVRVLLNGRVQTFRVSGIALSPEYVYAVKPGLPIPDERLYAILWVDRGVLEAAFDMAGAFNDAVVSLAPGTDPVSVITELDRLLKPYGSVGAIERRDQPSNRFLEDEFNQLKVMSLTIPTIFFAVAAFLLNVSLGRLVTVQREQIAALKALGFPALPLVLHYLKLVLVIVILGVLLGVAAGYAMGSALIESYRGFFRLPALTFALTPWSAVIGGLISFTAATLGALTALRSVFRITPAVAMRPPAPARSSYPRIERLLLHATFSPRRIMMLRSIIGRPWRTVVTTLGVAFAVPMVVLGLFWRDAIDDMVEVQFYRIERGNMTVAFSRPVDRSVIGDLAREHGVLVVEGQRILPVRFRVGHRSYLGAVTGLPPGSTLRRPRDVADRPIELSDDGITLSRRLAERLGAVRGSIVTLEVMEGRRRTRDVPVAAIVDESIGMTSYIEIETLNRMTGEGTVVSSATMYVDPSAVTALSQRFKQLPTIESVVMKAYTLTSFLDKIAGLIFATAGILTAFSVIIAGGVVYNSARISFQERAWELASLRVLGFSRAEVAGILFGEFMAAIITGACIGLAMSYAIVVALARFHSNESFQIPAVIEPRTYAAATLVVLAAAAASIFIVRRRLDRLDLVSALKTRD